MKGLLGFIVAVAVTSTMATELPPPVFTNQPAIRLPIPDTTSNYFPEAPPESFGFYPHKRHDVLIPFERKRLAEKDPQSSYKFPYQPFMEDNIAELPHPEKTLEKAKHLSLCEAIALALRNNPAIKVAELQRIMDKFTFELVLKQYRFQYTDLSLTANLTRGLPQWTLGSGVNINQSATGTTFGLAYTNNLLGGMGSFTPTVTQHLLKGFGDVNMVPYSNGVDAEKIARLSFKDSVIGQVLKVITAYRQLVGQFNSLDMAKQSLKNQEISAKNTEIQVKVGQMAPSDYIQQQTNIEQTRLSVVQSQDALRASYFQFLTALGLRPTAKIYIDRRIKLPNKKIPSLKKCIAVALLHNIAYRKALIGLRTTERQLITAENNRKWTLDATGSVTVGLQRTDMHSPLTDTPTSPQFNVKLSIPIDNIQGKSDVVSAKIAIENAKINLEQQKESLVSSIMNQVSAIKNQEQQIKIAENAVNLQTTTLNNAKLKLKYGQTDVFEINSLETDLLTQKVSLISAEITYLSQIEQLYQIMGVTLDQWGISLTY